MGGPAAFEPHHPALGFQRKLLAEERGQVRAPEDHVAPGQQRVEGSGVQLRSHGLKGLDGEQGDRGVHVRSLAEEPVPDDAFAGHYLNPVGIRRRHVRGAVRARPK